MPYFNVNVLAAAPLATSFTVEVWILAPSGWQIISLGQFGPVFPWSSFCPVMAQLAQSKYSGSALRVKVKGGSLGTATLPTSTASSLYAWRSC